MVKALIAAFVLLASLSLNAATIYDDVITVARGECVGACGIPEFSDKYFVGTGGSDSNDGRSHATRWATLGKVEASVNTTGADVYLLSDSVFEDDTLTIDWGGTVSDRAVVGTYCVDGASPVEWASGRTGCGAKAEINGNFEPSCASAGTCLFNEAGAIPASRYSAIVTVNQFAPYTTVENLIVRDSAGVGITVDGAQVSPLNAIVDSNEVYLTAGMGIQASRMAANDGSVIRKNYIEETAVVRVYNYDTVWPGCLAVNTNVRNNVQVLLENNVINQCGGEGISALRVGSVVYRGNVVSNTRRPFLYVDNAYDSVFENNKFYGIGFNGSFGFGLGIGNFVEAYNNQTSATGNVYRNNIVANATTGIEFGVQTYSPYNGGGNPALEGYQVGAKVYGNTFLISGSGFNAVEGENLNLNNNIAEADFRSNIFQNDSGCQWYNTTADNWSHNVWPIGGPDSTNCDGPNQQEGDANLSVNIDTVSGNSYAANIPTNAELTPADPSVALGAGDPSLETQVCLDATTFGNAFSSINYGNTPPQANWEKCLYYDAAGTVRDATAPTAGAIEYSPPEGAIPEDGTTYFVGTGGSDSNDGLTHATRWATLAKVESTVSATSADVYLLSGTVFPVGDFLTVDWGGTSSDPVVIDTYCVNGSTPVEYASGRTGCGSKAIIRGNMTEEQAQANNFDWNAYPQGGCASVYDQAVLVQNDYTTVKNLWIRESACSGLRVKGAGASGVGEGTLIGATIENNLIEYTGFTPLVAESGVQDLAVRGNTVRHYNKCEQSSTEGGTVPSPAINNCGSGGWPGGVGVVRSLNARALIEDNDIYLGYGEGINAYISSGVVIRGNRVGNVRSAVIYTDCTRGQIIAEGNIVWGVQGNAGAGPGTFGGTGQSAMSSSAEANCASGGGTDVLYRNNILLNGLEGLNASLEGTVAAAGELMGDEFYGNTIMASELRTYDGVTNLTGNNFGSMDVASNIFYSTTQSDAPRCRAEQTNNYNLWTSTPSDADCRGGNDVTGDPLLGETYSFYQNFDYTDTVPSIQSFAPGIGSPALNAGDPTLDTDVCISDPAYTDAFIATMSYPFAPDPALWRRCNYYDAAGTVRDATAPTAGALESSAPEGVIPEDGTVYFVGTGGSDSNDGLTHATRWATLGQVESTVTTTGSDVYLLTDTVFEDDTLTVNWNGTVNDRAVVGTYCVSGSTPVEWASGRAGCGAKAQLNGTLEQACREAVPWTCEVANGNAVPASPYGGLVKIAADYVSVKNLELRDSAGRGITGSGNQMASGDTILQSPVLDGLSVHYMNFQGMILEANVKNAEVRNSVFEATSYCEKGSQDGQPTQAPGVFLPNCYETDGSMAGGQPGCTQISRSDDSYSVFENNIVVNGRCEGFSTNDSTHIAVFGNRFAGTGVVINMDESNNNVVMRNVALGNPDDGDRYSNANQHGIQVSLESANDDGGFNIIANNMLAGGQSGIHANSIATVAMDAGFGQGGYVYGNTVVGQELYATRLAPGDSRSIKHWWAVNNIFHAGAGEDCRINAPANVDLVTYNEFTGTPADADCNTGVVLLNALGLPYTLSQYAAMDDNTIYNINYNYFRVDGTAATTSGSLPLSEPVWVSTLLNDTGWDDITIEGGGLSACPSGMPTSLVPDADCVARPSTPTPGALQHIPQ